MYLIINPYLYIILVVAFMYQFCHGELIMDKVKLVEEIEQVLNNPDFIEERKFLEWAEYRHYIDTIVFNVNQVRVTGWYRYWSYSLELEPQIHKNGDLHVPIFEPSIMADFIIENVAGVIDGSLAF